MTLDVEAFFEDKPVVKKPLKDRLNVGSGKSPLPEFHNLDLRPDWPGLDEVGDIRKVEYPDNYFREILDHDCLGHLHLVDATAVLAKYYRWLRTDGVLDLHTPNLRHLAAILSQTDHLDALMWLYGTAGEGSTNYKENTMRWCWSNDALTKVLRNIGFIIISSSLDCGGFGLRVIAVKR